MPLFELLPISPFADDFDFKIIKPAGSGDGMSGSDTGCIFVCFTVACNEIMCHYSVICVRACRV